MNNSINLLDYKNKIQPKHEHEKNKKRSLRTIAVGLLFTVAVFSMIFFILVAISPLPQLRKQEKIASFNLSLAHPDIVKLALVKERTDSIQQLMDKRPYYDRVLNSIQTKLPSGVRINEVSIDKDDFSVTLSSNSLLQLDNFLNELAIASEAKKEFSQIKIKDLSKTDTINTYLLTINLDTL